jgi:hypothetical protein
LALEDHDALRNIRIQEVPSSSGLLYQLVGVETGNEYDDGEDYGRETAASRGQPLGPSAKVKTGRGE